MSLDDDVLRRSIALRVNKDVVTIGISSCSIVCLSVSDGRYKADGLLTRPSIGAADKVLITTKPSSDPQTWLRSTLSKG